MRRSEFAIHAVFGALVFFVASSASADFNILDRAVPPRPLVAKYQKPQPTRIAGAAKKMNRYYFIRQGDNPQSVSDLIFGNSSHSDEILGWLGGESNWRAGAVLYYTSPDNPTDDKVESFYRARGIRPTTHKVARGETLSSLAAADYKSSRSWIELAWLNHFKDPNAVEPGQTIYMLPSSNEMKTTALAHEKGEEEKIVKAVVVPTVPTPEPREIARVKASDDFSMASRVEPSSAATATVRSGNGRMTRQSYNAYVPWTFPGINISSPAGFGADWGAVFLGGGYQNRARFTNSSDGAFAAGLGLGNAQEYVGLEVNISFLSVQDIGRGGLTLKLSRQLPAAFGVAVGAENITSWGGTDAPRSYYGSVSKVFFLTQYPSEWFSALTLTAGVGSGQFLSQADVNAGTGSVNVFGSAALRVQEPVAFIADWNGQDLNLGLSITPLRKWGLFINPSLSDVTGNAGDGVRFLLGVGFGYVFI